MDAVIYARYSSEKQNEKSIEDQIKACEEFAKENEFTIINAYIDKAKSGKTDHRPGFQQMIEDSKKKRFKFIICWKFDRISRNTMDFYYYEKILYDNDVKIVSVNERIDDPQAAPIIKAINLGMAESFNVTLAINVNRGMRSNARKCKSNGSLPVGYTSDKEGVIHPDPKVAPYIREAFHLFLNGFSYGDIADYFNKEGVRTKTGKSFIGNGIKRILGNVRYAGVYKYQDIVIDGGMPEIIDKETFLQVQEKMKSYSRPHNTKPNQERYFLRNKLFCHRCNKPLKITCGTSKTGNIYRYYKCDCGSIRKDILEPFILDKTKENILTDEIIESIANYALKLQKSMNVNTKKNQLKNELKELQKKIDRTCDLLLDGVDSPALRDKLQELEENKKDLELKLAMEDITDRELTKDDLIWYLNQFRSSEEKDRELEEQIMNNFISQVYFGDDKIWIQYNFCEKQKDTQTLALEELECSNNSHLVNLPSVQSNIFASDNGYYIVFEIKMQVENLKNY